MSLLNSHSTSTLDPANPTQVRAIMAKLLTELPKDPSSASAWFKLFCQTSDALSEYQTNLEIESSCDSNNTKAQEAIKNFDADILSQLLSHRDVLMKIYLESPWKSAMHADDRGRIKKDFESRLAKTSHSLTSLQLQENALVRGYRNFVHSAQTKFLGRTVQLSVIVGKLNDRNEAMRKAAFLAYWGFVRENEKKYQEIFCELRENRLKQATLAGSISYEEFIYKDMSRLDFSTTDCQNLRKEILKNIVPIVVKLSKFQAQSLDNKRPPENETKLIKPWNTRIWPEFFPKTPPVEGSQTRFVEAFAKAAKELGPVVEQCYQDLTSSNSFDIFPRASKSPGAFCALRARSGLPFVFGNFSVSVKDLYTLFHEFGHAVHGYLSAKIENCLLRSPGLEFCEFVSTSFEFLAQDLMHLFWDNAEDARRAKSFHQFHSLAFLPFAAQLDSWQSKVYAFDGPKSPAEHNQLWEKLCDKYRPQIDWSGIEELRGIGWCSRPHVFTSPFYYIDYAIAQLGAWELSWNSAQNRKETIDSLLQAMGVGGQRPMNELFQAAGCQSPFNESTVTSVSAKIEKIFGV